MADLDRTDWKLLYNKGLITARGIKDWTNKEFSELNGHVYTTELADQMFISRHRDCNIHIDNKVYTVRYYDGCFYPMWHKGKPRGKNDMDYRFCTKTNTISKIKIDYGND